MSGPRVLPALAAVLLALAAAPARAQAPDTSAWLGDFAALRSAMASHYANLEWAVGTRGMDLRALVERTTRELRAARSEQESREAIVSFLDAFADGHLRVQWDVAPEAEEPDSARYARPLSRRIGFERHSWNAGVPFARLDRYRAIASPDSDYFALGVLRLPSGRSVGVLRIALFSQYEFPDLCARAQAALGVADDAPCDADCSERFEYATADLLTAALTRQIAVLAREKPDALVVDITANGGGTNWVEPAMRVLSPKPVPSPRQGFVRHPHWVKQLGERLETIEADLAKARGADRAMLERAAGVLKRAIASAESTCIRDALWEGRDPGCTGAVVGPLYTSGIYPHLPPGALPARESSEVLYSPSSYHYRPGAWPGRLIVLVDRWTASSSERFAAALADAHAATIVGEPTFGAGCGYTNGGIPTVLPHSKGVVKMPDCIQLRADGSNAVSGIAPDVFVPWRANDSRFQRATRAMEALDRALRGR